MSARAPTDQAMDQTGRPVSGVVQHASACPALSRRPCRIRRMGDKEEKFKTRSEALKREYELKKLSKQEKENLIATSLET